MKPDSPLGEAHCSTTRSTVPGRRVVLGCSLRRPSKSSHFYRGPSATTCTRPSLRLVACPLKPSSKARERVHQRKPTPWTCPWTKAVILSSAMRPPKFLIAVVVSLIAQYAAILFAAASNGIGSVPALYALQFRHHIAVEYRVNAVAALFVVILEQLNRHTG